MLDDDKIVAKHNNLVEARARLSLAEQKMLCVVIAMIDSLNDKKTFLYEFSAFDLAKKIGYEQKKMGGSVYKYIDNVCRKLMHRELTYYDPEDNSMLRATWVASAQYRPNRNTVEIEISQKVLPLLLNLINGEFTKYKLVNVLQFKSKFSLRLFELLKQYERIKKRTFKTSELRQMLGIDENEYKRWSDFKLKVLETATKEINKKTDIKIKYTPKKTGRKYTHIEFEIRKNRKKSVPKKPESTADNDEKRRKKRVVIRKKFVKLSPEVQEKWINAAREKSGPDLLGLLGTNDQPGPILIQTAAELWAENAN